MILRQPNPIAAKQVYTQPVGTVDLTPTVMGLINLPSDPNDQGRDLSAKLGQNWEYKRPKQCNRIVAAERKMFGRCWRGVCRWRFAPFYCHGDGVTVAHF
jgi:arylsulfatase A-like enzyme